MLQSASSRAEDGQEAYAEHLFQEGVERMKSDQCPVAIIKFLSSQQLDSSAATLLNLATCYARLGRTASAWKTYRQAGAASEAEGNSDLKERAYEAMRRLVPSLTRLSIVPPRASSSLTLTLNGEPLGPSDRVSIPLDPGESIIEAVAPGRVTWRRSVTATDVGATIIIEVPELEAQQPPPKAEETSNRGDVRTVGLIVAGVGASGIVVGAILGLSAKSSLDTSNDHCRAERCNQQGYDLRIEAIERARYATYAVGLGALVTSAGALLFLMAPVSSRRELKVAPWMQLERSAYGLSIGGDL